MGLNVIVKQQFALLKTQTTKRKLYKSLSVLYCTRMIFHYRLHHHRRFCYNQYKISINLSGDI